MNYPAASCEVSNPHLRTAMAPPVWRGGCSCILCMSCMRTLEQAQLDVLARQLLLAFFTALLPNIFANDFCIPVTAYGTDARAFRPKLATPQTLFDGWDAVKDLTARETFDHLADLEICIPVTAYGTDARAFRPKLATPQTLFDGWDAVKDLTARETFDHLANL